MYYPHMTNDVYAKVHNYASRVHDSAHGRKTSQLQLFAGRSLDYVGTDILGGLPKTTNWSQVAVVMAENYNKLTMDVSKKTNFVTVARILVQH